MTLVRRSDRCPDAYATLCGMRDEFNILLPVEVRWGDMDAFGHVNNAVYFTYCESARIRYFDEIPLERYREAEEHGPALVSATVNFRAQVHYPASLEVGARVTSLGGRSFTHEYVVFRAGSEEIVADGTSVSAWVDYAAGRSIPLPAALKERIRAIDAL